MSKSVFRPLRARKAKFGFESHIHTDSFLLIGDAVQRAKALDENLKFDVDISYGSGRVKVYTDIEEAANILGFARYPD